MNIHTYTEQLLNWFLTSGLRIGIIAILTFIAIKVAKFLANRFITSFSRQKDDPEFQNEHRLLARSSDMS